MNNAKQVSNNGGKLFERLKRNTKGIALRPKAILGSMSVQLSFNIVHSAITKRRRGIKLYVFIFFSRFHRSTTGRFGRQNLSRMDFKLSSYIPATTVGLLLLCWIPMLQGKHTINMCPNIVNHLLLFLLRVMDEVAPEESER